MLMIHRQAFLRIPEMHYDGDGNAFPVGRVPVRVFIYIMEQQQMHFVLTPEI